MTITELREIHKARINAVADHKIFMPVALLDLGCYLASQGCQDAATAREEAFGYNMARYASFGHCNPLVEAGRDFAVKIANAANPMTVRP